MSVETKEGWQAYLTPGTRKAHYIVSSESLCRRVGFYFDTVEKPLTAGGKYDCAACRKLIAKRIADKNVRCEACGGDGICVENCPETFPEVYFGDLDAEARHA